MNRIFCSIESYLNKIKYGGLVLEDGPYQVMRVKNTTIIHHLN